MPRTPISAAILIATLTGCSPAPPGGTTTSAEKVELNGRGATFVEPIMKFWTNEYGEKTGQAVRINYQGTGSGDGINKVTDQLVDFGCSDAPMNRKQLDAAAAKGGPVVHVPLVIGAVVPMYNLPGVDKPVAFSGPVLADIFTGKITAWDDPKLKELNPGLDLPAAKIQPVFRADPSGTTFIFADYLAKVSPEFKSTVGVSNEPAWPTAVGVRQQKTDGVAGHVSRTAGAIGYVELTYALDTKSQYGAVVNRAGKPILADLDGITAAADATLGEKQTAEPYSLHDLTYSLTDAGGDKSYPIAGLSYALAYKKLPGAKGRATVEFLKWATSAEGQEMAKKRNYAPLPDALRKRIADDLAAVDTAG